MGGRSAVDEEGERGGHDDHAGDDALGDVLVARVVPVGGGDELVEADGDHHAGDHAEDDAEGELVGAGAEDDPGEAGADGLGDAGEDGPAEGFPGVARGEVDGDGDAEALGDVVDGDGDGERGADGGVVERADEGGEALGEVVEADGEGGHDAHALEARVVLRDVLGGELEVLDAGRRGRVLLLVGRAGGARLVELDDLGGRAALGHLARDELARVGRVAGVALRVELVHGGVDARHHEDAREQAQRRGDVGVRGAQGRLERHLRLDEDLDERHVEHDARGEPERGREDRLRGGRH
mmetsp:Transcript_17022/g.53142  ORF Transcript_17022/g.53142 Transcript_17022/m.53142 type:complete len:296 (-) Transcript_17022:148-1035(-)